MHIGKANKLELRSKPQYTSTLRKSTTNESHLKKLLEQIFNGKKQQNVLFSFSIHKPFCIQKTVQLHLLKHSLTHFFLYEDNSIQNNGIYLSKYNCTAFEMQNGFYEQKIEKENKTFCCLFTLNICVSNFWR